MYRSLILLLALSAQAHEMTPAYPKLESSHVDGVKKASMEMFNRRADVSFYEIGVFTDKWEPIPFVTSYAIFRLDYLKRIKFEVYIRDEDVKSATYICSRSKLRDDASKAPMVSSKICSKIK